MPINYVLVEKGTPFDPAAPKKYYAQAKSKGETTLRELSEKMSDMSSLSSADVFAVLEAMLKTIPEELLNGNIVKLGDFGSFYTVVTGKGSDKKDEFNKSLIDKVEIKFRPGKIVKNLLKNAKFSRID